MINQEERDFYNGYYDKIKEMESDLVRRVSETIRNINQQSETKMVEHMTTRIKTKKSATEKLILAGYEPTADNAVSVLSDVLGIRLIVHFIGDIYTIRNILVNFGDIKVIKEKDYVRNAKSSGYRGYHIIIEENLDGFVMRAEIQIRTIAMDCWASLEHQIRYKKNIKNTDLINFELKKCSDDLMSADIAMEQIMELAQKNTDDAEEDVDFFENSMAAVSEIDV